MRTWNQVSKIQKNCSSRLGYSFWRPIGIGLAGNRLSSSSTVYQCSIFTVAQAPSATSTRNRRTIRSSHTSIHHRLLTPPERTKMSSPQHYPYPRDRKKCRVKCSLRSKQYRYLVTSCVLEPNPPQSIRFLAEPYLNSS